MYTDSTEMARLDRIAPDVPPLKSLGRLIAPLLLALAVTGSIAMIGVGVARAAGF